MSRLPEEIAHARSSSYGIRVTGTAEVTDYYALGRWLGGAGSEDQATFLEGLSAALTLDHAGECQAAWIGHSAREGGQSLAIAKSLERIAREIERVGDNMQVGIVDDEPEGEHAPPNSTEPATVDNSGPDDERWHPGYLRLAAADLAAWGLVYATPDDIWQATLDMAAEWEDNE